MDCGFLTDLPSCGIVVGGHGNDRGEGVGGKEASNLLDGSYTVNFWHFYIHEDETIGFCGGFVDGFFAVVSYFCGNTQLCQESEN